MRYTTKIILAGLLLITGCGTPQRVKTGTFDATHAFSVTVPEGAKKLQAWFAMPQREDPHQTIRDWAVESPYPTRVVTDARGNQFLYLEAEGPKPGTFEVVTTFEVVREEVRAVIDPAKTRPHTDEERRQLSEHLQPSAQSVIDDNARKMAREAVGDETNPVKQARAIYDAVLAHVEYHVKDPKPNAAKTMKSSGTGSSVFTFEQRCGNCTDFHSLYAAVARAAGLPTRVVYGSFFKGPLDGKDKDQSYHCWIEFHAPELGWIPLDVAVADIFVPFDYNEHSRPRAHLTVADGYSGPDAALVDYYFGNLDERRVVWHRGRDLVLAPPQAGPPLLWNPKCYVELDGKPHKAWTRKLTYRQVK